jgi:GT2 family glycosyltransferase
MSGYAVSVVIACHDARRWPAVQATLASVAAQTLRPSRTVIVVDHNDELLRLVRSAHSGADPAELAVLPNRLPRGASGSRNTGAAATDTPLVAFLDGDMVVPPHWLAALVAPLREPDVVGAGGATYPVWRQRPRWVPEEFLWAFGGSYPGMPSQTATVRNVWSASMVVRREVFDAVGGFHLGFGKVGTRSRPEDTHL